ncbi:MAG: hypothetical protein HPZ91_00340 [Lentisphaeria bacterium]|nr:hypothetical protein [Lentisphaeria bacterium]
MKAVDKLHLKHVEALLRKQLPRNCPIQITGEGETVRIRTDENCFITVMMKRDIIVPVLLDAGFKHVALDLEGASNALK